MPFTPILTGGTLSGNRFRINTTDPPDDCDPTGPGYKFILPEATGRDGVGNAVGAVGYPRVEIRFSLLPPEGWEYYAAFCGEDPSAWINMLELWNPYGPGGGEWQYFHGVMLRPTYAGTTWGDAYKDVTIRLDHLEEW